MTLDDERPRRRLSIKITRRAPPQTALPIDRTIMIVARPASAEAVLAVTIAYADPTETPAVPKIPAMTMPPSVIAMSDLLVAAVAASVAAITVAAKHTMAPGRQNSQVKMRAARTTRPPSTSRVHRRIVSAHNIRTGTKKSPRPVAVRRSIVSRRPAGTELAQTSTMAGSKIAPTAMIQTSHASSARLPGSSARSGTGTSSGFTAGSLARVDPLLACG
jgi:hypothetical protein